MAVAVGDEREAEYQALLDESVRRQAEAVGRAIAAGGLPSEADADEVDRALQEVFDVLESIVWRVEGICESDDGSDLPFTVGAAEIGVVAMIADMVALRVDDCQRMHKTLSSKRWELATLRHEQIAREAWHEHDH